jgi:hypothetical protein
MSVTRILTLGVAATISLLAPGLPVSASEAERYWRSIERICETGVTPDAVEASSGLRVPAGAGTTGPP